IYPIFLQVICTTLQLCYCFFLLYLNISQSSAVNVCSSNTSFLRSYVRRNDSFLRHALICVWLLDNNTSGTVMPRKSLGRVYCGYSNNLLKMDSVGAV